MQQDHKSRALIRTLVKNSRSSLIKQVSSFLLSSLHSLSPPLGKENKAEIENLNANFKFMDIQIPYVQTDPNEISILQ